MYDPTTVAVISFIVAIVICGIYFYLNRNNRPDWYRQRKESSERIEKEIWFKDLVDEANRLRSRKS